MLSKLMAKKRKGGFTLIEILVVIVVIGLLFMFFIPRIDFAGDKARETGIKSDFRSYMLAAQSAIREGAITTTSADSNAVAKAMESYLDKKLQFVSGVTPTPAPSAFKTNYTISFTTGTGKITIFTGKTATSASAVGTAEYKLEINFEDSGRVTSTKATMNGTDVDL